MTVSELAPWFGTTRPSIYAVIERADLQPDKKKRYDVFFFMEQMQRQQPLFLNSDNMAPGALWFRYRMADIRRFHARATLAEAGLWPWDDDEEEEEEEESEATSVDTAPRVTTNHC